MQVVTLFWFFYEVKQTKRVASVQNTSKGETPTGGKI